jgi:hypothetical protein
MYPIGRVVIPNQQYGQPKQKQRIGDHDKLTEKQI